MHDKQECSREANRAALNERPAQKCDLIMKGGVTSGVVYPPAILKLAEKYRFHAIGGASAGAIAAAAAAAAEYGRQGPAPEGAKEAYGFVRLAELNDELSGEQFVRKLFKPSEQGEPLFKAFLTWKEWEAKKRKRDQAAKKRQQERDAKKQGQAQAKQAAGTEAEQRKQPWWRRAWEALVWVGRLNHVCWKAVWGHYLAGALVGLSLAVLLGHGSFLLGWELTGFPEALLQAVGWGLVGLTLLAGGVGLMLGGLAASGWAFKSIVTGLEKKDEAGFGLCPGSQGKDARLDTGEQLVLTDWLHARLNALAGLRPSDPPITVAQLKERQVHFKLMTSNLTLGQPYILPMQRGSRSFFFKKSEMERLFPKPVVDALVEWGRANRPTDSILISDKDAEELFRFPLGEDLPLVVATRMSLSFPVLLSAVRLYSVKSEKYRRVEGKPQTLDLKEDLEEHWWSDGGITSNFPIHVFDAWVPQHPTFGITLYDSPLSKVLEQREGVTQEMDVHEAVVLPYPRDFDKARPRRTNIDDTLGFLRAIFETAQSYRDNAQAGMPSYRERVIQLFLEEHEGGLNLDMPSEVIQGIQAKGQCAAQKLLERYGTVDGVNFAEHRWVRMQVLMAELELQLFEVRGLFKGPGWKAELQERFKRLFEQQAGAQASPWYRNKDAAWCKEARERLDALLELVEKWDEAQARWKPLRFEQEKERAKREGKDAPKEETFDFFFAEHPPRPQGVLKVTPNL